MSIPNQDSKPATGSQSDEPSYYHRNRRVDIPDGAMVVGLIVGAHGLRGEVRIEPHTDYAQRFAKGNSLLMGVDLIEMHIVSSRPHKGLHLVFFEGITNRTEAEALRGRWLFIPDQDAAQLDDDHYWIHELVGMEVQDMQGRTLGTVRNVMATGANDVFLVDPFEDMNRGKEILLPAIAEVVQSVDPEKRQIVVNLIPGLLDLPDDSDGTD